MKTRALVMAGMMALAVLASTRVAQAQETMRVNIPFDFVAGNTSLWSGGNAQQTHENVEGTRLVRGRTLPTSLEMARAALDAMDRGRVVAVPGLANRAGSVAPRFAPRSVVRRATRWIQSEP